jgi:hypothetical protein
LARFSSLPCVALGTFPVLSCSDRENCQVTCNKISRSNTMSFLGAN